MSYCDKDYDKDIDIKVEEVKMFFNNQVLDILEKSHMTQAKMSDICGMARQNVTLSLHKGQNSTIRTLCRIADALGYKIKIILEKN